MFIETYDGEFINLLQVDMILAFETYTMYKNCIIAKINSKNYVIGTYETMSETNKELRKLIYKINSAFNNVV